jgi:hypothetical protein
VLRSADLTAGSSLALLVEQFRHLRVLDLGAATGLSAPPPALLGFETRGLCNLRHLCLSFCQDLSSETLLALLWHAPGASSQSHPHGPALACVWVSTASGGPDLG